MKLVDILARELKVWPEKSVAAVQQNSTDDRVSFVDCMDVEFSMGQWDYSEPCMRIHEQKESHEFERADDWKTAIVTRAEWQAAVDALKVAEGIADAEAGNLIPLDDVKSKYVEYSPAMHAQRVGRVTRVASQPALGDSREQFESWAGAKFVGMNFLLSGDADIYVQPLTRACYESFQAGMAAPKPTDSREQFEQAYSEDNGGVPVAFLMSCRQGDSYTVPKVARAWYWWKRARAGVVVDLGACEAEVYDGSGNLDFTATVEAIGLAVVIILAVALGFFSGWVLRGGV